MVSLASGSWILTKNTSRLIRETSPALQRDQRTRAGPQEQVRHRRATSQPTFLMLEGSTTKLAKVMT